MRVDCWGSDVCVWNAGAQAVSIADRSTAWALYAQGRFFRDRIRDKQMAIFKDGYVQVVMTAQIVMTVDVPVDGI